jgi:hypothetical protein
MRRKPLHGRQFVLALFGENDREQAPITARFQRRVVLPSLCASWPEFNEQQMVITRAGERVLANELDWIEINGIDKWLGGVHLTSSAGENPWRWNPEMQRLIQTK